MNKFTLTLGILGTAMLASAQPMMPSVEGFDTRTIGIDQKLNTQVPLDLQFKDEDGKTVKLGDYFNHGKPVIFNPVFYECKGVCELSLSSLSKALVEFQYDVPGSTFEVITFTIKPTETTEMAKARKAPIMKLLNKPGAEQGWHFLTGDLESISKLTAALGFRYTYIPTTGKVNHAGGIMIATPTGKIAQYIYGSDYPAKLLLNALDSANGEKISEPVSKPVLLGCFDFDPTTGKYRLVLWRSVQVAGLATVLILAVSIAVMTYRHKAGSNSYDKGDTSA